MIQDRIAQRYAQSVYDLATEKNQQQALLGDFKGVREALKSSRELALMLQSPIITHAKKASVLQAVFGGKVSVLVSGLFDLLAKRGREALIPYIANEYIALYNRKQNIWPVTVTSATSLEAAQLENVRKQVEKALGGTAEVQATVNPDLIGGLTIQVGDRLFDGSVRHQLEKLRRQFAQEAATYIDQI